MPSTVHALGDPRVFTVSEITREVRCVIEQGIGTVSVSGEVSNYRRLPSGHQYFTLKDDKAQLACVLFYRPGLAANRTPLADGMQVIATGRMTVYETRGQYQLNVAHLQAAGAGLLQARFEALKRRLAAEGLFAADRKRPLPAFPMVVGLITSPTGAAIRDMLHILHRRAPWLRVIVHPARVQGAGAAAEMAAALGVFNAWQQLGIPRADVLIIGRGGGSAEDLWEFNEEILARAIVASRIPVVSAVGHEIDFTIADFAADLRAPTPSAAAELVAPDSAELRRRLSQTAERLARSVARRLEQLRAQLELAGRGVIYLEPRRRLSELAQTVDLSREAIAQAVASRIAALRQRTVAFEAVLRQHRPDQVLRLRRSELRTLSEALRSAAVRRSEQLHTRLQRVGALLRVLGPQATLDRGYTITRNHQGRLLRSAKGLQRGEILRTRFADGEIDSVVEG